MKRHQTIALVASYSLSYCRRVLRGVKEFARSREDWVFVPVIPDAAAVRGIARLKPDGVIAHVLTRDMGKSLAKLSCPSVNVSGIFLDLPLPRVSGDNLAVGRMAATHLIDRGLRAFAFVGNAEHGYSVERETGFRAAIEDAGFSVQAYNTPDVSKLDPIVGLCPPDRNLRKVIEGLEKPVGIFACNDVWGLRLTEICRQMRMRVPEDVAIVGVDNDDLLCELARPPLSSVSIAAERVGYLAAECLSRLMEGAAAPKEPTLVQPVGVMARQSSDILAIDEPDVAAAVRFIRERSNSPIRVADVLEEVPVSRRALERKFRQVLRRGPFEEIRRCQIQRARTLLSTTDWQMPSVAEHSGFTSAKQLSTIFHEETGETPTAYRQRFRLDASPEKKCAKPTAGGVPRRITLPAVT